MSELPPPFKILTKDKAYVATISVFVPGSLIGMGFLASVDRPPDYLDAGIKKSQADIQALRDVQNNPVSVAPRDAPVINNFLNASLDREEQQLRQLQTEKKDLTPPITTEAAALLGPVGVSSLLFTIACVAYRRRSYRKAVEKANEEAFAKIAGLDTYKWDHWCD